MLYDWTSTAALGVVRDIQPKDPLTLTGEGLWVCLISSGRCTASLTDASPSPAGSALILPPQSAAAGHLVLSRAPLTLTPEGESHLLCIQLTGQAAVQFLAGLTELPFLARGETCPAAAELLGRLAAEADTPRSRAASQLAFALLCELAGADSAAPPLPPLVEAAIEDIRQNYAGLYGVEELSERLGVSKSHLVRTFTAAVGVPPGRYLTTVRVEAAMRLLLHREYTLDVIASLCGFSGANYLCRVFKKETGQSPAQWRAMAGHAAQSGLSPEESLREQELYIKGYAVCFLPRSQQKQGQHCGEQFRHRERRPYAVHAEQAAQHQRAGHDGHHAAADGGDRGFHRAVGRTQIARRHDVEPGKEVAHEVQPHAIVGQTGPICTEVFTVRTSSPACRSCRTPPRTARPPVPARCSCPE